MGKLRGEKRFNTVPTHDRDGDGELDSSEMTAGLSELHAVWVKHTFSGERWPLEKMGDSIAKELRKQSQSGGPGNHDCYNWDALVESGKNVKFNEMWGVIDQLLTKIQLPPDRMPTGTWGHAWHKLTTWVLDDLIGVQTQLSQPVRLVQPSQPQQAKVLFMPN